MSNAIILDDEESALRDDDSSPRPAASTSIATGMVHHDDGDPISSSVGHMSDSATGSTTRQRPGMSRTKGADNNNNNNNNKNSHNMDSSVIVEAYQIQTTGSLEETSLQEALELTSSSSSSCASDAANNTATTSPVWVDATVHMNKANNNETEKSWMELNSTILSKLSLPPFLRRHLSDAKQLQTPQVLPLSKACFILIRILSPTQTNNNSNDILIRHTAAICLKDTLVTITTTTPIQSSRTICRKHNLLDKDALAHSLFELELPEASVSGGVVLWLSFHLAKTTAATHKLRARISEWTAKMDSDISSITLASIIELKDDFLRISAVAEEQSECVQSLADVDYMTEGLDFANLKGNLGVLVSTVGSTERMIFRLEKRIQDLRCGYEGNQQARINHRLNVLTILSAVFLPLTLMAGIWGMNFTNMPELERENAYFFALAAMAVVAISFLFGFYWNGWFDD